jgi:hypothetical protein
MATPKDPPVERVQDLFRQLSKVAPSLNSASDKLGKSVTRLEDRLKPLGLGVTSWVDFNISHSPNGYNYHIEELGYTRSDGKWGFAIRTRQGSEVREEDEDVTSWAFNEAPRSLRVRAVKKIPELLEKLIKDVGSMAKSVAETADEVDLLANALDAVETTPREKKS